MSDDNKQANDNSEDETKNVSPDQGEQRSVDEAATQFGYKRASREDAGKTKRKTCC